MKYIITINFFIFIYYVVIITSLINFYTVIYYEVYLTV